MSPEEEATQSARFVDDTPSNNTILEEGIEEDESSIIAPSTVPTNTVKRPKGKKIKP